MEARAAICCEIYCATSLYARVHACYLLDIIDYKTLSSSADRKELIRGGSLNGYGPEYLKPTSSPAYVQDQLTCRRALSCEKEQGLAAREDKATAGSMTRRGSC